MKTVEEDFTEMVESVRDKITEQPSASATTPTPVSSMRLLGDLFPSGNICHKMYAVIVKCARSVTSDITRLKSRTVSQNRHKASFVASSSSHALTIRTKLNISFAQRSVGRCDMRTQPKSPNEKS